ncbi:kinase-like domain-containing protein [Chlamydoabsidia padenii]|nr:kinase-like domain-containing protein [Chlamydoabsidia padenii]
MPDSMDPQLLWYRNSQLSNSTQQYSNNDAGASNPPSTVQELAKQLKAWKKRQAELVAEDSDDDDGIEFAIAQLQQGKSLTPLNASPPDNNNNITPSTPPTSTNKPTAITNDTVKKRKVDLHNSSDIFSDSPLRSAKESLYPTSQTKSIKHQATNPSPGNEEVNAQNIIEQIKFGGLQNIPSYRPQRQTSTVQSKPSQEPINDFETAGRPSNNNTNKSINGSQHYRPVKQPLQSKAINIYQDHDYNNGKTPPPLVKSALSPKLNPKQPTKENGSIKDEPVLTGDLQVRGKTYTILNIIGNGGSSAVYRVLNQETKAIQALKRVNTKHLSPNLKNQYKREINFLAGLNEKGCLHVAMMYNYGNNRETGIIDIILELGDIDFAAYLQKQQVKPLNMNFVRWYGQQMLESIAEIHRYNLVHYDIKPSNFILKNGSLKLIDFGISKAVDSKTGLTAVEHPMGTLSYMAPESLSDKMSSRGKPTMTGKPCDIWAYGCTLYQMVYGHTPFHKIPQEKKSLHITDPSIPVNYPSVVTFYPPSSPAIYINVGPNTIDILKACLNKDPLARQSAKQLLEHPFFHPM